MKKPVEIAVVSAKGGAGKTLLASSLGRSIEGCVMADCDVDAPSLRLLFAPTSETEGVFLGDKKAVLNMRLCTQCGDCFRACRFEAVREGDVPEGWLYSIDTLACQGCGVCARVCPRGAIDLVTSAAGTWYVSATATGPLVHASLSPGQRNAGGLVGVVKREARRTAARKNLGTIVIDGPAGMGWPVESALAGVSVAVFVAEPTVSGTQGLRHLVRLAGGRGITPVCVINRHDINPEGTNRIKAYLSEAGIELLGTIPFSTEVRRTVANRGFALDLPDDPAAEAIRGIVDQIGSLAESRRNVDA
jgi:MinD superfamily P-loop ATPase